MERIAKVIAHAGICSRRQAELRIQNQEVLVNGKTIDTPSTRVSPDDVISVNGQIINKGVQTRLWLYHKPVKVLVTRNDPQGRRTFLDDWHETSPHIVPVGRLDYNSEGLLLLTNNGDLARKLCIPLSGIKKYYEVRIFGAISEKQLKQINSGLRIDGVRYEKVQVKVLSKTSQNTWVLFTLTEGKNREIRNITKFMGWRVSRLVRTAFGPFSLGTLKPGNIQEVGGEDVCKLEKALEPQSNA